MPAASKALRAKVLTKLPRASSKRLRVTSTAPGRSSREICMGSEVQAEEFLELLDDVVELLRAQARPDAEPEGLVHHDVGVGQLAAHAEVAADHVRLAREVAGEQQ